MRFPTRLTLSPRVLSRAAVVALRAGSPKEELLRGRASYAGDKEALLARLRKMEGQVRGIGQMVEDGRYCLDVLQQINALTAAAREVALILVEDHLRTGVADAIQDNDGEAAIREMTTVLRKVLRP